MISLLIVSCYSDWWGTIMETSHYYLNPCLLSHFWKTVRCYPCDELLCFTVKAPLCLTLKEKWKTGRFLKELKKKLSFHNRLIPGIKIPGMPPTIKKDLKTPSKAIWFQRYFISLKWPVLNNKDSSNTQRKRKE